MSTRASPRDKSPGMTPADVPIDQLPVVKLTAEQVKRAADIAQSRCESYDSIDGGIVFGSQSLLHSHQVGVVGEMAVAKLYDVSFDDQTYQYGDQGSDLRLAGLRTDVKSTASDKVRLPELLVRADKSITAELFIRAHVLQWGADLGAQVRIIGCAKRSVVAATEPKRHPGHTLNYVVEPSQMALPPLLD